MPPLLEIKGLTVNFELEAGTVHAVTDLSYGVDAGETLGIVGESGSGKSVHVLSILGLLPRPPGRVAAGQALFNGVDLLSLEEEELRRVRGRSIGMIFQDPMSSLNPVLTVERQIAETIVAHGLMSKKAARARAVELLDLVGIPEPHRRVHQFPHQFSGGMRQRVMIAIGIACEPQLLIADEPTTALDVTVQAQILELMADLRKAIGMAMIWITHDMGVVAGFADTVQVMYAGRIQERGPTRAIFGDTRSAYTLGLLDSIPDVSLSAKAGGRRSRLRQIPGMPPDMLTSAPGDPFAPRNPFATDRCRLESPPLRQAEDAVPGHLVAAWYDLRSQRTRFQSDRA